MKYTALATSSALHSRVPTAKHKQLCVPPSVVILGDLFAFEFYLTAWREIRSSPSYLFVVSIAGITGNSEVTKQI